MVAVGPGRGLRARRRAGDEARSARAARSRRDTLAVGALALAVRLLAVAWAWGSFPPAADGSYYHRLAARLAAGQGYTWLWPDGAVTYAAHYPVGYPGALALLYALVGPRPEAGMLLNALVGALAAVAVHRLLVPLRSRRLAWLGAALVALHPGLVAYTPALMTEGITAALLAVAAWLAALAWQSRRARARLGWLVALGVLLGACTLVRPQCLLLAPLLGLLVGARRWPAAPDVGGPARLSAWLRAGTLRRAVTAGALVTAVALAVCAPWTLRNCARMGRCALVSVNAGWNLLIGTSPAGRGGWAPLEVPAGCRTVFDEAAKDRCFERAALARIRRAPGAWLALGPRKLAVTFDYCGAAGWYLHESNSAAFGASAKLVLGAVETAYERLVLVAALLALRPARRARRGSGKPSARPWPRALALVRRVLPWGGVLFALLEHAWVAVVLLAVALALRRPPLHRSQPLYGAALAVIVAVAATHALFFGAGRYGLVAFPLICALAALGVGRGWLRQRRLPRR